MSVLYMMSIIYRNKCILKNSRYGLDDYTIFGICSKIFYYLMVFHSVVITV